MGTPVTATNRRLTAAEFQGLTEVPPELEWFANINNRHTRRAYQNDVSDFSRFVGITTPEDMRIVTRAHVIAWRDALLARGLSATTIRRKLSALSSLFEALCERNAVVHNPVTGVKRPGADIQEGKTPAHSNDEVRAMLAAPPEDTLKGKRDRAILATLLYHGLREEELCRLTVADIQNRSGVPHFRIHGKRDKIRFVPIHPLASRLIALYQEAAGHREGPLFRPVRNNTTKTLAKPLHPRSVYRIVHQYGGHSVHACRATAATNALDHEADIAKVQQWLGHANISTTRLYDRRHMKAEQSPTFKVAY